MGTRDFWTLESKQDLSHLLREGHNGELSVL